MHFQAEREPEHEVALALGEGVLRIVARNAGPMTYYGTNTYVITNGEGTSVLDPGPDDDRHVEAVLTAAGGRIDRILLSHGHRDHVAAAARLSARSGAPILGFSPSIDPDLTIDRALGDGDEAGGLVALYTPGHTRDHLCFATRDHRLFTGDHVMAWSTSAVSPPDGDMASYLESLRRLMGRHGDRCYLPAHGPALQDPLAYVGALLAHRLARERAVLAALGPEPATLEDLARAVYPEVKPALRVAAERTLLSHLRKLVEEGRARRLGHSWMAA